MTIIPFSIRRGAMSLICLAAALMTLLSSCAKNEFKVEVELRSPVNESYSLTYYVSDKKKGWITENAVTVQNGRGMVRCITRNPTLVWISRGSTHNNDVAFYAERGDKIAVTGKDGDPMTWEIGGNDINEEWSAWRIKNADALRSRNAEKINAAVKGFVEKNRDSEVSVLLMLTTYDRQSDEKGYAALWNKIDEDAKTPEILAAVGRADQLTAARVEAPSRVQELKMHCVGETIMSVKPAVSDALLMYFWTSETSSRKSDIDSLRAIYKENHGGKLLKIMDVALARDSMSWLSEVRRDSLPGEHPDWLRAWAPGGRLHSSVVALSIPSSTWFIVMDRTGRQVYRGMEVKEALRQTRATLKKAPARKAPAKKDSTAKATAKPVAKPATATPNPRKR